MWGKYLNPQATGRPSRAILCWGLARPRAIGGPLQNAAGGASQRAPIPPASASDSERFERWGPVETNVWASTIVRLVHSAVPLDFASLRWPLRRCHDHFLPRRAGHSSLARLMPRGVTNQRPCRARAGTVIGARSAPTALRTDVGGKKTDDDARPADDDRSGVTGFAGRPGRAHRGPEKGDRGHALPGWEGSPPDGHGSGHPRGSAGTRAERAAGRAAPQGGGRGGASPPQCTPGLRAGPSGSSAGRPCGQARAVPAREGASLDCRSRGGGHRNSLHVWSAS